VTPHNPYELLRATLRPGSRFQSTSQYKIPRYPTGIYYIHTSPHGSHPRTNHELGPPPKPIGGVLRRDPANRGASFAHPSILHCQQRCTMNCWPWRGIDLSRPFASWAPFLCLASLPCLALPSLSIPLLALIALRKTARMNLSCNAFFRREGVRTRLNPTFVPTCQLMNSHLRGVILICCRVR
jgi:hypothetical protein